jgi:hypothetical protein
LCKTGFNPADILPFLHTTIGDCGLRKTEIGENEARTNSIEITFLEANSCLLSQEIRLILWKPKAHYLFHKISLPTPFQNLPNPEHATSLFLEDSL